MDAEIHIPVPEFHHPAELAMIARLRDDGTALLNAYLASYTREGVVYIARDAAKRIFPEYNADRTGNNRNSDRAASALADAARRTVLRRPFLPPRNIFQILTGCPASGKTMASTAALDASLEIVYETIITSLLKVEGLIQEALDRGRRPMLQLFYLNDPRLNVRRMIDRARRIGRTVPLAFMAKAYVEVPVYVAMLGATFQGALDIGVIDNSYKPGHAIAHDSIARTLSETGVYTVEECLRCMDDELEQIHRRVAIPDNILREARLR
jgi:hypothetical protein